jgi:phage-related protein
LAQTVGQIGLDLVVNDKQFKGQMSGLQGMAMKAAKMLAGAFAIKKLVDFGAQAIKLGSDLNEVQNVVDVAFPRMSKQVDDFAKQAMYTSGLSETMAKRYTGTFGAMTKAFGFSEQKAYEMSTALTSLAGDVASFYNISQDEAYTKLKSVFTGETETLKDLGVVMTQSALDAYAMANGFGKTTQEMSEAEKVALRFAFVTDKLSLASGDFARTSDSWANQVRIMKLQFESFMASVGAGLINIFTPVIKVINFLLSKLLTVGNAFKALTELFTGKKSMKGSGIQETADAVGNLGEASDGAAGGAGNLGKAAKGAGKAADGAGKAAKKAAQEMKSLMGFDQINKLSDSSDNGDGGGDSGGGPGGSGGGGGGTPKGAEVDMGKIAEGGNQLDGLFDGLFKRLLELVKLFQNGFNASFRFDGVERLQSALKRIGELLQEIFTDPKVVASFQTMLDKIAYALGQFAGSIGTVALGIGVFIAESIANGLERQKERIIRSLVAQFENTGNMFASAGNIAQAFADGFYDVMTSTGAIRIGSSIASSVLAIQASIVEIGFKLGGDLMQGIERIITDNMPGVASIISETLSDIAPVFESAEQAINDMSDSISRVYDQYIRPTIESSTKAISSIIGVFVNGWNNHIQPVIKKIGQGFSDTIGKHISPLIQKILDMVASFQEMSQVINAYVAPIISFIVEQLTRVLAPAIEYIGEVWRVLSNTISDVLGGIADFLKGVFDIITGILTSDMGKIFDGFTETGDAIMNILSTILTGLLDLTVAVLKFIWDTIVAIFQGIWDGIVAIFTPLGEWFAERWNDITTVLADVAKWFGDMFQKAWDAIVNIFTPIGSWFGQRWADVTSALANIGAWFTDMFQKAWTGLTNIFSKIGSWFSQRYNELKSNLASIPDWFKEKFRNAWTGLTGIFNPIASWFAGKWSNIQSALASIPGWFSSKFREAYNNVKNAFSGIIGFFSGLWGQIRSTFTHVGTMVGSAIGGAVRSVINGVLGTVESTINSGISLLNGAISVINKLPGVNIGGFSYIGLPRLAQGGFVKANTPQIAMIGDNKHYGEIVAPENKMLEMARRAAELSNNGGGPEVLALLTQLLQAVRALDLTIDGDKITKKIVDKINEIAIKTGESPLMI